MVENGRLTFNTGTGRCAHPTGWTEGAQACARIGREDTPDQAEGKGSPPEGWSRCQVVNLFHYQCTGSIATIAYRIPI